MSAKLQDVRIVEIADDDRDVSYLDQGWSQDRLAAYRAGEFYFVGVRAVAEILLEESGVVQTIESPGLWGIESDSGAEYLEEVGKEEEAVLRDMLLELHVDLNGLLEEVPA